MLRHRPSGVAVLSPTESGGCSGSDITEPASPRSPESSCSNTEDSASARMPPWASDPASPAPRRIAAQPVPLRRPTQPSVHRCITEYFSHKMKPPNGLKRDANASINDDTKRKCLAKNGLTPDWENYISYLSQTLNPKVLLDVGKQVETVQKSHSTFYGTLNHTKSSDVSGKGASINLKYEANELSIDNKEKVHTTTSNGFIDNKHHRESTSKPTKSLNSFLNGLVDSKKSLADSKTKTSPDPSASGTNVSAKSISCKKRKVSIPVTGDHMRIAVSSNSHSHKKIVAARSDNIKMNGVVSSTTKLDSRMNGVTCGSNNLSLTPITPNLTTTKKDVQRKSAQSTKRTNRKSSACIANSKNLTWSKANNLKQVQLQKQNCVNSAHNSTVKNISGEITLSPPKINIPNGVRQVPMNMNGTINNINVPVTSLQNCHQLNIPQPCNGTVSTNNLTSFVTVPQNVMLTALRIPQNGITAQTLNQQGNITGNIAFNRPNVNVSSPTKLNGQFVFPLMQNINGTVVQIPNLMTKMPNFVLPQASQLTAQTQDHLQNQQAAQILINGTLLKLANTMTSTYPNVNKSMAAANQSIPVLNKNVSGMQTVGMTVQPKPNYTVNLSQPILMPQPGYIVTSVPNMTVKETYSYSNTNTGSSTPQTSCSNPIVQHPPPIVANFTTQALHTSSIPIAPVKPPDHNPIQGTEPPSSTVKEPEFCEPTISKCDIPWLSKNVNNNIVPLDTNKLSRPFAEVSSLTEKLAELSEKVIKDKNESERQKVEMKSEETKNYSVDEELRKIEEVARREDTIFTQITVLKDVTSNVHSTVIEANFCSATTESSESGIGTDKSIDSPSDSQTSKECDEDSSLSLSISVCSVDVQDSQKSPILKQPKTLRFPPRNPVKTNNNQRTSNGDIAPTATVCLWENCKKELECDTDLLEHLQSEHVETQAGKENFVCLWEQCKVRGKPSCSRLWLERHALSHGGNKPFKCIVDGCGRRFSTRMLLERHVNNHFNEISPSANSSKKTTENAPKLIRRNGKKLRYRRQPWSARMFDFFDAGMMEGLAWRLARCTRWRLGGGCPLREPSGRHTLTLHAALTATRYNAAESRREALLTYYPPHVIDDEWVPEKEVRRIKRVEISSLPAHTKVFLFEQFTASYRSKGVTKAASQPATSSPPVRTLPVRHCNSSRLLNNLIAKQKLRSERSCSATNLPMICKEEERVEVSGAKKRKLGRRHGNSFWPCGR